MPVKKKSSLHKSLICYLKLQCTFFKLIVHFYNDKFENAITHVASVGTFPIARVLIIQSQWHIQLGLSNASRANEVALAQQGQILHEVDFLNSQVPKVNMYHDNIKISLYSNRLSGKTPPRLLQLKSLITTNHSCICYDNHQKCFMMFKNWKKGECQYQYLGYNWWYLLYICFHKIFLMKIVGNTQ